MAKWLRQRLTDFDLIHIHSLYRFPMTYAGWLARKMNVPYIISPHGSLDPFLYKQSRYNVFLKRIYERVFDLPNLDHAAAVHFTTQAEAESTNFLDLKARCEIVPLGIDWETYKSLPVKGAFRKRSGLGGQTPLVLFLGRINFTKGLDLLVPAFASLLKELPEAHLALVGPDNEGYGSKVKRWCAEQGIQEKVVFVGHLGADDVREAYVDADVFVLPSYTESFGLTVVEAMACGCPVVLSDQVKIWREVQHAGAGLVTGIDADEIAEALYFLLTHKQEAMAMGVRGREVVEKRFTWDRIVDKFTKVYQDLIPADAAGKP
jgi:glycosyltransferase involved in cell wall biosynthesis